MPNGGDETLRKPLKMARKIVPPIVNPHNNVMSDGQYQSNMFHEPSQLAMPITE